MGQYHPWEKTLLESGFPTSAAGVTHRRSREPGPLVFVREVPEQVQEEPFSIWLVSHCKSKARTASEGAQAQSREEGDVHRACEDLVRRRSTRGSPNTECVPSMSVLTEADHYQRKGAKSDPVEQRGTGLLWEGARWISPASRGVRAHPDPAGRRQPRLPASGTKLCVAMSISDDMPRLKCVEN